MRNMTIKFGNLTEGEIYIQGFLLNSLEIEHKPKKISKFNNDKVETEALVQNDLVMSLDYDNFVLLDNHNHDIISHQKLNGLKNKEIYTLLGARKQGNPCTIKYSDIYDEEINQKFKKDFQFIVKITEL